MVDYDDAVAAVQDPQADPIFLAKIAYENPEFGANVAANPRAYPGLLRWLAEFGDDRARDVVAQLGYAVPSDALGSSQPQVRSEYDGRSGAVRVVEAVTEPERPMARAMQTAQAAQTAQTTSDGVSSSVSGVDGRTPDDVMSDGFADASAREPSQGSLGAFAQAYARSAYVRPAQNPYGFSAELAASTTDQMQMAEIAQKAPELHAALAGNPNLYPALVDWLAQLGDPAVDAALAARR